MQKIKIVNKPHKINGYQSPPTVYRIYREQECERARQLQKDILSGKTTSLI